MEPTQRSHRLVSSPDEILVLDLVSQSARGPFGPERVPANLLDSSSTWHFGTLPTGHVWQIEAAGAGLNPQVRGERRIWGGRTQLRALRNRVQPQACKDQPAASHRIAMQTLTPSPSLGRSARALSQPPTNGKQKAGALCADGSDSSWPVFPEVPKAFGPVRAPLL